MELVESISDSSFCSQLVDFPKLGLTGVKAKEGQCFPKVLSVGQVLGAHLRTKIVRTPKFVMHFISAVITLPIGSSGHAGINCLRNGSCLVIGSLDGG
jgi:hypothetical protein